MIRSEVRTVVVGALSSQVRRRVDIEDSTPLLDSGLDLDSIQFLEVVFAIEQATGIVLRGEDLTTDAIATVESLVDHVLARCGG